MKQDFDKLDIFIKALNIQTKLYCNVDNAYDETQAIVCLKQLAKSWHMDDDHVILTLVREVQSEVDKQLRYMVEQVAESLHLPLKKEEFRQRWNAMPQKEKIELADCTIALFDSLETITNKGGMTDE